MIVHTIKSVANLINALVFQKSGFMILWLSSSSYKLLNSQFSYKESEAVKFDMFNGIKLLA
jgi:hypothetical protein